jgi:hypothetical protein
VPGPSFSPASKQSGNSFVFVNLGNGRNKIESRCFAGYCEFILGRDLFFDGLLPFAFFGEEKVNVSPIFPLRARRDIESARGSSVYFSEISSKPELSGFQCLGAFRFRHLPLVSAPSNPLRFHL